MSDALDKALVRIKAATPVASPWTAADFSDDTSEIAQALAPIDDDIATILNAVVAGTLVRAALCASGQQVRELEWVPASYHGQDLEASAFGVAVAYRVAGKPSDWTLTSIGMREYIHTPGYQTRAAASAAAQADYERRILAALTPTPDHRSFPDAADGRPLPPMAPAPQPEGRANRTDPRIVILNAEALSEIKAVVDGESDQDVGHIIYGLLDEIAALTPTPEAAQAEAVPVAWWNAIAPALSFPADWREQAGGTLKNQRIWANGFQTCREQVSVRIEELEGLTARLAAPAPGIAEALATELDETWHRGADFEKDYLENIRTDLFARISDFLRALKGGA